MGGKEDRLRPRPWAADYIHLRALRAQLARHAHERLAGRSTPRVLDVGCGARRYEPLFAPLGARYVGLDAEPGPGVDVVGTAAALPFADGEFDCVLCTQVLQYLPDPAAAVGELHRVLAPGGTALVSTHGVSASYPGPPNYWRWTRAGLERVFGAPGAWRTLRVVPQGGAASAIAYLGCREIELAAARARVPRLGAVAVLALNALAWNLDRARRRSPRRAPDLAPSYLVVAERA